jgi:hypothetical protein
MHVTETGTALRHLGQSLPFQQTTNTLATSYLCAVRHATQRSAPVRGVADLVGHFEPAGVNGLALAGDAA